MTSATVRDFGYVFEIGKMIGRILTSKTLHFPHFLSSQSLKNLQNSKFRLPASSDSFGVRSCCIFAALSCVLPSTPQTLQHPALNKPSAPPPSKRSASCSHGPLSPAAHRACLIDICILLRLGLACGGAGSRPRTRSTQAAAVSHIHQAIDARAASLQQGEHILSVSRRVVPISIACAQTTAIARHRRRWAGDGAARCGCRRRSLN